MKYLSLLLIFLSLEGSAQLDLLKHTIIDESKTARNPISTFTADMDGDGDLDILSASFTDDKIGWFENIDGLGDFSTINVLSTSILQANSVYADDLDGDGDLDIICAAFSSSRIYWFENLDGNANFGVEQLIDIVPLGAIVVDGEDIDADGDQDILVTGGSGTAWYENTGNANNFVFHELFQNNLFFGTDIEAADIDGDGDLDIVNTSLLDPATAWFENLDGLGDFSDRIIIEINDFGPRGFAIKDIDGNGTLDIIVASFLGVFYYENTDGNANFSPKNIINNSHSYTSLFIADIDNDGDQDICAGSEFNDFIKWFENTDGQGTFNAGNIVTTDVDKPSAVVMGDLDNDQSIDLISASNSDHKIAWYKNIDHTGVFGPQHDLTIDAFLMQSIVSIDIDDDGDLDIISCTAEEYRIIWLENLDGNGLYSDPKEVTTEVDQPIAVSVTDINGDGHLDIVSASKKDNKVAWYENENGTENFGNQQIITTNNDRVSSLFTGDLDGDGDIDVLYNSQVTNKVTWQKNLDGLGTFGPQITIANTALWPQAIYAADINGDGHLDVISGSAVDHKIAYYLNNGAGVFDAEVIVSTTENEPEVVIARDLDGDNDLDLLVSSLQLGKITWYENEDGNGNFSPEKLISGDLIVHPLSICTGDVDNDGDLDVLAASSNGQKLLFYENLDGQGDFSEAQILDDQVKSAVSVVCSDVDGDNDIDIILGYSDGANWYENLDIVLDVEYLEKFKANIVEDKVILLWKTALETNLDHYIIERSIDALSWSNLQNIEPKETSKPVQSYIISDDSPVEGRSYYRLKEVDHNGQNHYSNIESVFFRPSKLQIYPNPNQGNFQVVLDKIIPNSSLIIYNLLGEKLKEIPITKNSININIKDYKTGVYYLNIVNLGKTIYSKKIIKE